jgi:hypothetical protein
MAQSPVKATGGFLAFMLRHWILALAFVVVLVLFLARPIYRLLAKIPVVGAWVSSKSNIDNV